MSKRASAAKLFFYDLHGIKDTKVQVIADARSDLDEAEFSKFHSGVKCGDVVGIVGFPGLKKQQGRAEYFPKNIPRLNSLSSYDAKAKRQREGKFC
uniref:Lysyl-tRNA synthetase n=1 Tax=Lactuca sativa TaxID=4236 RepID=A0A9R1X5V6_LACSA|nr:hypothetical protein LSAT_V11C600302600 [Lactuca sativa]